MTSTDCFSSQTTLPDRGSPKLQRLRPCPPPPSSASSRAAVSFHSLFLHEIVDRGLEQLRRSAKDLLRLTRNVRVNDILVDPFRDALLGLGGVLQHSHLWITLMATRKPCMAKTSTRIPSRTWPIGLSWTTCFFVICVSPDFIGGFFLAAPPTSQPPPLQTSVHRGSNHVEGREGLRRPPSPPPLPSPCSHASLSLSLPVLPDTVYPKFQVPSISSFQFQIRCSKISTIPDRKRGDQHHNNIAAEAMTMQDKY